MIDENKVLATVTNISGKLLTFDVLNPIVNGELYFKDHLNNAVYYTERGQDIEVGPNPSRNRDLNNPYYTGDFPTGYVSGNENFYPMKLKAGETKQNLVMIKQVLDAMVTRGLVTYVAVQTRAFAKVKSLITDISVHGVNIPNGKTVFIELTDEVQDLIADNKLVIIP